MMAPETVVTVDHNKPNAPPPQQQGGALDWLKINVDYFKMPPGVLKIIQLYWADIKHKAKARLARRRQNALGTGGGPSNQEAISEIDNKILSIIGELAVYGDIQHKVPIFVLGILCMALGSPWYSTWFVFVAVTSFITTLLWTFVYLLSIREVLKLPINWVLSELISTTLEAVMYLIAFIVMFAATAHYYGPGYGSNVAAAVFGIFNTAAYAASSFLLFKEHKQGSTGQPS